MRTILSAGRELGLRGTQLVHVANELAASQTRAWPGLAGQVATPRPFSEDVGAPWTWPSASGG